MLEKKLIEKDVEVTKIEKRVVEVYHYDGKNYYDKDDLRIAIAQKMFNTFSGFLYHATASCNLVWNTSIGTLEGNLRSAHYATKVFGSDKLDETIDQLKELKSIYSQVTD